MTSIDPSQRLLTLLRSRVASAKPGSPRAASSSLRRSGAGGTPASAIALAERIRALSPEDPDRHRKAVRLFLESEITRELGPELVNDPGFAQMVDAVQVQMDGDAQTAAALRTLGEVLVGGGVP